MEQPLFSKIEHPQITLRDKVQESLRSAIIEGRFQAGERLIERPLCEQLGVSRTVIRETIRYLEAEGLVEILPGRGPIVALMDWKAARQIYEIRRLLETAAARQCAQNMCADIAVRLRRSLKQLEKTVASGTSSDVFRQTSAFYQEIFKGADHAIAWEVVERLNGRISRLRMMTMNSTDRAKLGIEHMQAICRAVLSGDPGAAASAIQCHLDDTSEIAEKLLQEDSV